MSQDSSMSNRILVLAAVLLCATPILPADSRWIRMAAGDFEVISSAGEGDTRRTLEYFERASNFFTQATGHTPGKTDLTRIILFGSKKEYELYRPFEFAAAYYTQSGGRDYIVLGGAGDEVFPIAAHEYTHLIVRHAGLEFPPWLNEGLAELYSTLTQVGDKVEVGLLVPGRVQALRMEKWVPLAVILAADHNSPYYSEKSKAGSLYNEGWILTHMLQLGPKYLPKFQEFLNAVRKGEASQPALERVYGVSLAVIEKDLQGYIHGNQFKAALFSLKLSSLKERTLAEGVAPFDVKLALLDLSHRPGKEAENRTKFEELAREEPARPEPWVGLGYLAVRSNGYGEASKFFEKALELGSKNPQMLWDYGRMASQSNPSKASQALTNLLDQDPARMEVRLALAQVQLNAKQPAQAKATLAPVRSITPADAPKFFRMRAFANMQSGDQEGARNAAQSWRDNAKNEEERDNADQFIRYLDSMKAGKTAELVVATDSPADQRPRLARTNPPQPPQTQNDRPRALLPRYRRSMGNFVELDCRNPQPRVVLQVGAAKELYLIDDPQKIHLTGNGTLDLNCGPQKPVAVGLEYAPPEGAESEVKGVVRAIYFGADAPDN